jgi:hypothetical protein
MSFLTSFACHRTDVSASYGSKGNAIIQSTLLRMFDPRKTSSDAFSPLSLSNFTQYFLVPYVAHNLIAEDLRQSPKRAFDEMLESANAGESLHPELDDDEELEAILEANVRAASKGRQAEKTSNRNPEVPAQQKSSKVCKVLVSVSLIALALSKPKVTLKLPVPKPRPVPKRRPPAISKPQPTPRDVGEEEVIRSCFILQLTCSSLKGG